MSGILLLYTLTGCGLAELQMGLLNQNVPLRFYGQMIDQDSNPVPNVKIEVTLRHWGIKGLKESDMASFIRIEAKTGPDGRFYLRGKTGDFFDINSIRKEGYKLSEKAQYSYKVAGGSPTNPVIFKMWKKGVSEPLVEGSKIYKIIPNGQPFTIDLLNHEEKPGISSPGDIVVKINRPEKLAPGRKFDWSYSIEAINGGIIQTNTDFLYQAPETGYAPTYEFSTPATNAHWFGWAREQFYIKSRGGQVFGSLEIEVSSDYNGGFAAFRINSALNPSGSRNLER